MAGLADHLARLLFTAKGARVTRPPTINTMISRAHTRHKTWRAVAAAFGVSESTLRRWRRGEAKPSAEKVTAMRSWDTASRMRKGAVPDSKVHMVWEFDGRTRQVDADHLRLAAGTMDAVRAAWVTGGPDAAVAAFVNRIGDQWYRQHLAAYDLRAKALDRIPDADDWEDTDDWEDVDLEDILDEEIVPYDLPYEDVAGEEIQGELSRYDMTVHSL